MAIINIKETIAAGFDQMQIARIDSNGYPAGITGSISQGETAFLRRFAGVKTANVQVPANAVVSVTGDDGLLGTFQFQSNEPRTFELATGELDFTIMSEMQGSSIYQVGTYYDFVPFDVEDPNFNNVLLWLTKQGRSTESGKTGAGYRHMIIPLAQLQFQGDPFEEQAPTTNTYTVTFDRADKFPWGNAFSADNIGKTGASGLIFFSQNRMTLDTYRYNGSDTTFLLSRVPWTDANGIIRVAVWKASADGTSIVDVTSSVSIVAATKTVTISGVAAKTAGDYFFSLVEYE